MILWIRCCIILHNLIIRIEEGTGVDSEWREALIQAGLQLTNQQEQNQRREEGDLNLSEDIPQLDEHPGQVFRQQLMEKLFDSPYTQAFHRP